MGVFQFNSIARATSGPQVNPALAVAIFAVLGTSSAEPTDGPGPQMFSTDAEPEDDFGYGPMPEAAAIISSYNGAATIGYRLDEDDPGDYGTIDVDGFFGTAVPLEDSSVVPVNDHEIYILFTTGGTLGTAGIRYSVSLDGGRSFILQRAALGVSDSITIARANAKIVLHPPSAQVTALVALANDARTQTIAHFAEGSTVHLTADVTSGAGIGSAATNEATAITLVNQLRSALIAHATNNTVHTADDTTSFASLPAAAATGPGAIALAIAIKGGLNAHLALTGSVHGSTPATADVAAADPVNGTVVANDVIEILTIAPTWDATALGLAIGEFGDLTQYTKAFGGIVIRGRFPIDAWATLINGLDYLRSRQRSVIAIIEARLPDDGEDADDYLDSLEDEWAGLYDERVYVTTGDGRYDPVTLAKTRHQDRRLHTAPLAARLSALDYAESPGVVATSVRRFGVPSVFGGPLDGYRIRANNGALFGIDAFLDDGAQAAAGFGSVCSVPNTDDKRCYCAINPVMRAPIGSTAPHIAHQRIATVVETIIYIEGTKLVQSHPAIEAGQVTIRGDAADQIDAAVFGAVIRVVGDPTASRTPRISSFTFAISRTQNISTDPVTLEWSATMRTGAYIAKLSGKFSINGGS